MSKIIILLFFGSLLFAVQPVVRNNRARSDNGGDKVKTKEVIKIDDENKNEKEIIKNQNNKNDDRKDQDRFHDADSNGVNDQREDDLQKIKNLNSKFKDLIKKTDKNTKTPATKKTRQK